MPRSVTFEDTLPTGSPVVPVSETSARMARLLLAVVQLCTRYPWTVLGITLVSLIASLGAAAWKLEYHTQRNDLISAEKEIQKRWKGYLDAFGDDDDLIFVIKGQDRARMIAASDDIAGRLRANSQQFDRVFHRVDLRELSSRSLLFLPVEEIAAINRRLDGMSPLLGPLGRLAWPTLTLEALLTQAVAAAEARSTGRSLSSADQDLLDQLPTVLQAAAESLRNPTAYRNPWRIGTADERQKQIQEPQYFFTPDGQLAMVLARPRKVSDSFTPAKQACDDARAILATMQSQYRDLEFGLTGIPVLESDEMAASEEDSTRASWMALLGVAILYTLVYRGLRYPSYTVGTLLVGTIWALGWATLTVGHLNILSATFAVMIIGMGDYGVLWISRFDEEHSLGRSVAEALRESAIHAGPSITTAAITTALAFFATIFADFQAVAELGWIAGSGVLFCALACLTTLPAAITIVERTRTRKNRSASGVTAASPILPLPQPFLPVLSSHPQLVLAGFILLMTAMLGFAGGIRYDANLLKMQAAELDSVKWEHELIAHAAGATWDAMSIARNQQEAQILRKKYEALPEVSRVVDAATLLPTDQDLKLPLLRAIQAKFGSLPSSVAEGATSNPLAVRKLLEKYPNPNLKEALARPDATMRLKQFDARLRADLLGDLESLKSVSYPQPILIEHLPESFRERYIGAHGEFLVRAFAANSLWEFEQLEQFTAVTREVDPEATGKSFRTLEGLRQMKDGFEKAGLLALIVIVIVLWLDLRGLKALLLGLFPLAIGITGTLGVMSLCGVALNPANMIALPLIVGVGVDNGVHVLHDYRDRVRGKLYRLGAATGRGILVAALTTILGFGTMCLARHRGMASLGLALSLGVSFCMLASLVALPAMLRIFDTFRMKRKPARRLTMLKRQAA